MPLSRVDKSINVLSDRILAVKILFLYYFYIYLAAYKYAQVTKLKLNAFDISKKKNAHYVSLGSQ